MLKYVHHVQYIVKDRDAMVEYIKKNFGMEPSSLREHPKQGLEAYYDIGETQIQFTAPVDPDSVTGKFLAKHGPGVYHVAWAVDDVRALSQELAAKGTKMWSRGKEGKVFASENVDGTVVCNIDPPDSLGLWFQLVTPKEVV